MLNVQQLFFSFNIFALSSIIWLQDNETFEGRKRHTQSQLRFNNSIRNILQCIDFLFFLSVTEFVTEYKLLWSQKGSNYSQKYAFKLEVFVIFSAFQSIHNETSSEIFAICMAKEYEYSEYLRIYSNALESMLTKSVRFKSNNKITQCGKNLQKKGSSLWQPSDSCKLNVRTIILHKRTIGESAVMGNDYTIGHCLSHYIQLWSFFLSIQFIDLFASKFVKNHFFYNFDGNFIKIILNDGLKDNLTFNTNGSAMNPWKVQFKYDLGRVFLQKSKYLHKKDISRTPLRS